MKHEMPPDYDQKFADFIKLCETVKADNIQGVVIAKPWVLGDTYDEVMESLSRLADAGLTLHIAGR
jgi:hypothetical protein